MITVSGEKLAANVRSKDADDNKNNKIATLPQDNLY
jgi:hypothetical protein